MKLLALMYNLNGSFNADYTVLCYYIKTSYQRISSLVSFLFQLLCF